MALWWAERASRLTHLPVSSTFVKILPMWYTILLMIHVVACIFLVTVVLLQQGKGADVGAVFGGSSQTLFGTSGAGNFLTKLTSATAIIFMLTSLSLTYGAAKR